MAIYVDDLLYAPTGSTEQTVRDLTSEISRTFEEEDPRMIVAIRCDGRMVPEDRLEAVLDTRINQYERLELQTQPLGPLVQEALGGVVELLEGVRPLPEQVADHLDAGRQTDAMHGLQQLIEAWKRSQEALTLATEAMKLNLDQVSTDDRPLPELLSSIRDLYNTLRDGLAANDLVIVGDVLRYEFPPLLEAWILTLENLRQQLVCVGQS